MPLHKNLGFADGHVAHSLEYADSTARTSATGLAATDVGRVARQLSDGTFWVLQNHSPLTWAQIDGAGGGAVTSVFGRTGAVVAQTGDYTPAQVGADPAGTATSAVASHEAAADPHTQYQRESEKGVANGYASLDATGKVPAAQLPSGGGSFDARDVLVFDHFVSGNVDLDELGSMGWRTTITGTGADALITSQAGHPGIVSLGSGTALAARAAIHLGQTGITPFLLATAQNQIDMEWLVSFDAAAIVAANVERVSFGFGLGFDGAASAELTDGIYCEFDPTTSPNLRFATANASTRTKTTTDVAVVANTWYRVGIRVTYPGGVPTAELLVNGVVKATHTANFPTAAIGVGIRIEAGTSAVEGRVLTDYVLVQQVTAKET